MAAEFLSINACGGQQISSGEMKNETNGPVVETNIEAVSFENDLPAKLIKLIAVIVGLGVAAFVIKGLLLEILNHLMRNIH